LLPSLPPSWKNGSITGLKARGNFEVSIAWENNVLTTAEIVSNVLGECSVRPNCAVKVTCNGESIPYTTADGVITFNTEVGNTYVLSRE
jgi:alpha-L-fucosidase 2